MQFPRPLDRVSPQLPSYIKEHPWFFLLYSYYVYFQSFILSNYCYFAIVVTYGYYTVNQLAKIHFFSEFSKCLAEFLIRFAAIFRQLIIFQCFTIKNITILYNKFSLLKETLYRHQ